MKLANVPCVVGLGAKSLSGDETVVLEVFVASQTKDGQHVGDGVYSAWVERITSALVAIGGGATAYAAAGAWFNPTTRQLQTEPTTVVRTYADRSALRLRLPELRQTLVQYGRECEQHTVAFALDGELFGFEVAETEY